LISADAGLVEFRKRSGFGDALTALNENPLPHALVVRPNLAAEQTADLAKLANDLRQLSNVEVVQLDSAWIERFNAMVAALRRTTTVIGVLLGLAVVIVVGNAIRADIEARRDEIEVTKLVGGSDAFVRRPFLYTGFWYGLAGGVLALLITYAVLALLGAPVRRIALLYGSNFELAGLGFLNALAVLGAAVALAWAGSYAAASRHLRAIEPK
jgi:cell division transport system permease protein